jgi:hypothetical protein
LIVLVLLAVGVVVVVGEEGEEEMGNRGWV